MFEALEKHEKLSDGRLTASRRCLRSPELWNGRIWARRDCEQQGDKLHCIVGQSYDSLLDPGNDAMGDVSFVCRAAIAEL